MYCTIVTSGREGEREGGRERGRKGEKEGGRERGREGEREGEREGGREGGRETDRQRDRESIPEVPATVWWRGSWNRSTSNKSQSCADFMKPHVCTPSTPG